MRALLVAAVLGILGAALPVDAQPPAKAARIGILSTVNPRTAPWWVAFDQRLAELGFVEGQNLTVDFLNAEGQVDRLPDLAAELVRRKVDLILCGGPEAVLRAARQAPARSPSL